MRKRRPLLLLDPTLLRLELRRCLCSSASRAVGAALACWRDLWACGYEADWVGASERKLEGLRCGTDDGEYGLDWVGTSWRKPENPASAIGDEGLECDWVGASWRKPESLRSGTADDVWDDIFLI